MNLDSIEQELDRLYVFEIENYVSRCDELKKSGFKIYRNDNGRHKVVMAGLNRGNVEKPYVYDEKPVKKEGFLSKAKKKVKRSIDDFKTVAHFIKVMRANRKNER